MVGQRKRAEHIPPSADFHNARSRANAALKPVANHTAPRAHSTLGEIFLCVLESALQLFAPQAAGADVVEIAIVAFEHYGIHRAQHEIFLRAGIYHMAYQRVVHAANVQRVCERDGRFQRAQFFDLHQAQRFAKSVQHKRGAGQLGKKGILRARYDDGYARLAAAFRLGEMPYAHAGHIAQVVSRAALHACTGAQFFYIHMILPK